jgi:hypothetical protein
MLTVIPLPMALSTDSLPTDLAAAHAMIDRRADDARSRPYLGRGGEKPPHSAARS